MERLLRHTQRALARMCLAMGVTAAVIGCHSACSDKGCGRGGHGGSHPNANIDNCSDIEQGAIPLPVGTHTNEILNRQAAKAERDDFVLYYNEWIDGKPVLGPYGSNHLRRIIDRLPFVPFTVVVQPEPNQPILTGLRHTAVIEALTEAGIQNAAARVTVTQSPAEPLYGEQAGPIYQQLIRGGGGGGGGGGLGFSGGFGVGGGFGGGFGAFGGGFGFR